MHLIFTQILTVMGLNWSNWVKQYTHESSAQIIPNSKLNSHLDFLLYHSFPHSVLPPAVMPSILTMIVFIHLVIYEQKEFQRRRIKGRDLPYLFLYWRVFYLAGFPQDAT